MFQACRDGETAEFVECALRIPKLATACSSEYRTSEKDGSNNRYASGCFVPVSEICSGQRFALVPWRVWLCQEVFWGLCVGPPAFTLPRQPSGKTSACKVNCLNTGRFSKPLYSLALSALCVH